MNNNAKFLEISQAHRISRLLLLLGVCVSKTVDEAICGREKKKQEKGRKKQHLPPPLLFTWGLAHHKFHFRGKKNPVTNSP